MEAMCARVRASFALVELRVEGKSDRLWWHLHRQCNDLNLETKGTYDDGTFLGRQT